MNNKLMFSSDTGEWDTDQAVVDDLATVFKWNLDICASRPNVCETYFSQEQDAFNYDWAEYALRFINPPYGRGMDKWVKEVYRIRHSGATVCLLPARTDTAMWQKYIPGAALVTFIKGRLKFGSDESWIKRYYDVINDGWEDWQKREAALKKIGGKHFVGQNEFIDSVIDLMTNRPFDVDEWLKSDKLHKDSAPFPSAFVVFGEINQVQQERLSSYGWTIGR